MNKNNIVTINGQQYDTQTGLPVVGKTIEAPTKRPTAAASIHNSLQKSQTLIRRVTKKPTAVSASRPKNAGRTMDIARSSKISRFAPHPVVVAPTQVHTIDLPAAAHPVVSKANDIHAKRRATVVKPTKTSQDIKHEAITAALAKPSVKEPKKGFLHRHPRVFSILSISIVLALLGGYLTYVNLPSFSVRVAAAQAGIDATYPEYRPDGYSLGGVPLSSEGKVILNFVANTGSSKFTLTQAKSSWDSSAVLDNIVRDKAGDKYITNQERGLTIYTYSGNAAWVNGGILYTIEGNAPLSGDQIRHIATSL